MATKKQYLNLIRYSCLLESFISHYFLRMIVIYQLANGVTPWIAVSIPIVYEFAKMLSRGINVFVTFAIKVNFKKYHIIHLISFTLLGFLLTLFKDVYSIYIVIGVMGIMTGIKHSSVTKLNIQNKEYESFCFVEEERSIVIGGALGLVVSQFIFDINPFLYAIGFVVLLVIGTLFSFYLKDVKPVIESDEKHEEKKLTKKEINQTILITILFGILAGLWCMGYGAFNELIPLITDKIAYLESVFFIIEFIILIFMSGKLLAKIKKQKKLLLVETIIAIVDVCCLLIALYFYSWQGVLIAYILMASTSPFGDPIWGSIMSSYANGSEEKWIIVNKTYFIIRTIFTLLTWYICKEIIIHGVDNFKYLGISLIVLIIIVYFIANKVNKYILKTSV